MIFVCRYTTVCLPAKHNDITINTFSIRSVDRCQILLREINLLGLQANGTSKIWLYMAALALDLIKHHEQPPTLCQDSKAMTC